MGSRLRLRLLSTRSRPALAHPSRKTARTGLGGIGARRSQSPDRRESRWFRRLSGGRHFRALFQRPSCAGHRGNAHVALDASTRRPVLRRLRSDRPSFSASTSGPPLRRRSARGGGLPTTQPTGEPMGPIDDRRRPDAGSMVCARSSDSQDTTSGGPAWWTDSEPFQVPPNVTQPLRVPLRNPFNVPSPGLWRLKEVPAP